jgi:hypothetical protein
LELFDTCELLLLPQSISERCSEAGGVYMYQTVSKITVYILVRDEPISQLKMMIIISIIVLSVFRTL